MREQVLAPLPTEAVFLVIIALALLAFEAGFRLGRWREASTPEKEESASGLTAGSLLGLFAFLLAFTMGMAADRFEARRLLVLDEANSIETTFLRAGFLAEPDRTDIRNMLRQYVPLRVTVPALAQLEENNRQSREIQDRIWARTEPLAAANPDSVLLGTFVTSLNEMIDLQNARLVVGVYSRVPNTVIDALLFGGGLAIFVLGYHSGLGRRRNLTYTVPFVIVLCVVLTLIIDLDRPREGFVTVSQQALIDLQAELGPAE